MNKRIKQIEEQCYIKPGGYYPGSDWPVPFFDKQKFAELIVRECIDIADEYDGAGSTIVSRIKKHFGVEE
jgi:hypothetical protein